MLCDPSQNEAIVKTGIEYAKKVLAEAGETHIALDDGTEVPITDELLHDMVKAQLAGMRFKLVRVENRVAVVTRRA